MHKLGSLSLCVRVRARSFAVLRDSSPRCEEPGPTGTDSRRNRSEMKALPRREPAMPEEINESAKRSMNPKLQLFGSRPANARRDRAFVKVPSCSLSSCYSFSSTFGNEPKSVVAAPGHESQYFTQLWLSKGIPLGEQMNLIFTSFFFCVLRQPREANSQSL